MENNDSERKNSHKNRNKVAWPIFKRNENTESQKLIWEKLMMTTGTGSLNTTAA